MIARNFAPIWIKNQSTHLFTKPFWFKQNFVDVHLTITYVKYITNRPFNIGGGF